MFRALAAALACCVSLTAHAFDLEGHRGARGLAPNTARGPDGRRLSAPGPMIHDLSYAELERYDVGRLNPQTRYARRFPDQVPVDGAHIPRLADLFALVKKAGNEAVRFNIETKLSPEAPGETLAPGPFVRADRSHPGARSGRTDNRPPGLGARCDTACGNRATGADARHTLNSNGCNVGAAGYAAMDHDALSGIEEFCAAQYYAFDAGAWISRAQRDGLRVAAAAEYLALTSWYGHEDELADVAARIRAQIGRDAPEQLPLARFSARTRYLLAQRQNGPAGRP